MLVQPTMPRQLTRHHLPLQGPRQWTPEPCAWIRPTTFELAVGRLRILSQSVEATPRTR